MEVVDGLYEFLGKKVNGYIDINNGKLVYQVKFFELGIFFFENIGEKIYLGIFMIFVVLCDLGFLVLYMFLYMVVWYYKYNEMYYGQNQDYKVGIMFVKEYLFVKFILVFNVDNYYCIFWIMEGNIYLFEYQSGEMIWFNIEQQDWMLKVWSNWKEFVWVYVVGFKYIKKEDMDYIWQMIFCNEYDCLVFYFVEVDKDVQLLVGFYILIVMVGNMNFLVIIDIENVEVGSVIILKCGSVNKGVKIDKSGKFDLIFVVWEFKKGDMICLMKCQDGKFIELGCEMGVMGVF